MLRGPSLFQMSFEILEGILFLFYTEIELKYQDIFVNQQSCEKRFWRVTTSWYVNLPTYIAYHKLLFIAITSYIDSLCYPLKELKE